MTKEFGLLSLEQIKNSEIFKKYGVCAEVNDYAILLGMPFCSEIELPYSNSDNLIVGDWLTSSKNSKGNVICMNYQCNNDFDEKYLYNTEANFTRCYGIRPCIPYDEIANECTGEKTINGVTEVLYGEYVENAENPYDNEIVSELDKEYENGTLLKTGKEYTADSRITFGVRVFSENYKPFKARTFQEYFYKGKKYIHIICEKKYTNRNTKLSNGVLCINKSGFWLNVKPVVWLIDKEKNIAVAKNVLLSGIRFDDKVDYDGDFKETEMYKYLNEIFAKEIVPSEVPQIVIHKDYLRTAKEELLEYAEKENEERNNKRLHIYM